MDITPNDNSTQPISDDQDLAKALAGVLPGDDDTTDPATGLQFEETPAIAAPALGGSFATPEPAPTPAETATPIAPVAPLDVPAPTNEPAPLSGDLASIKSNALTALRPLIGKVDLPAEEKFDTYLMLIRSTDDTSLIGPAHAAAQEIADEKRKAEALLDIIKEIDYLSRKDQ